MFFRVVEDGQVEVAGIPESGSAIEEENPWRGVISGESSEFEDENPCTEPAKQGQLEPKCLFEDENPWKATISGESSALEEGQVMVRFHSIQSKDTETRLLGIVFPKMFNHLGVVFLKCHGSMYFVYLWYRWHLPNDISG